ncbi:MAG: metalloregulator ArsR/SmtB family transcription factor [Gemmatimonadales bacterium]|nr:metalloregulator ArsR/SmtB family transcription factor [Gemmatimonadales bacterium]
MAQNPGRRFKDVVYEQLSRVGKALASPRRLELLDLLAQGPRTVEGLARESGQTIANTSQHLKVLREARLVDAEKSGLYVTYRLADQDVAALYRALRGVAESRLAEIDRVTKDFLHDRGLLEPVDAEALRDRVRRGEVTVLDVRPAEEYRAGHIPGAISLPLAVLERRLATLPRDRELVAYCRGPYCVLAVEAVQRLRREGFRAVRLEDGVPEWRARGLAVAVGDDAAESDR